MEETALKIRLFGDPVLRKKAKPVKHITGHHRDVLSQMAQLMYTDSGIGLAATQLGINETMMVADIGNGLYKLINPKIVKRQGRQIIQEGCLSVPGICIKVKRAKKILVEAQDEFGKPLSIEAQDLLACVFQHEIDHLKGRLIIDYASFFEKLKIKKKLKELKERAKYERLSQSETKSHPLQL
jgi:peptide deformylase